MTTQSQNSTLAGINETKQMLDKASDNTGVSQAFAENANKKIYSEQEIKRVTHYVVNTKEDWTPHCV